MIRRFRLMPDAGLSQMSLQPVWALRQAFAAGDRIADFKADLLSQGTGDAGG